MSKNQVDQESAQRRRARVVSKRESPTRPNRAVTIRCVVCGLEVTGVRDDDGFIRPSDRARPAPAAPVVDGYCIRDAR